MQPFSQWWREKIEHEDSNVDVKEENYEKRGKMINEKRGGIANQSVNEKSEGLWIHRLLQKSATTERTCRDCLKPNLHRES